ncbi:MAG: hypothetical protein IJA54_07695 [Tyzzerella sp.]|nr:hypothetical protein [Tyzzerella sp.]
MERLKKYEKQIVAVMSVFVILVGGIFSTSFDSLASDNDFYLEYPEPAISSTQGYVSVVFSNSSGAFRVMTFFWSLEGYYNADSTPLLMRVRVDNGKLEFFPSSSGSSTGFYSLNMINPSGLYNFVIVNLSSETYVYNFANLGYTLRGWRCGGNGFVEGFSNTLNFSLFFSSDASSVLLGQVIDVLTRNGTTEQSILTAVGSILNSVDGVENQLSSVISYLRSVDSELDSIKSELEKIYDKADEILNEQKKQTSWLERIWDSIQEFFNPSEEEKTESEQFESETTDKSDEIGGLVEDSKTEKPDVDDMSDSIDSNLDMTSANEYGAVLLNITENEYILQMLLIVVTVAIIAYVLFGKR